MRLPNSSDGYALARISKAMSNVSVIPCTCNPLIPVSPFAPAIPGGPLKDKIWKYVAMITKTNYQII